MAEKYDEEASPLMFEKEKRANENLMRPENELATAVSRKSRKRKTSLVVNDSVIVIIEFLQILALIQSMSLKWTYPDSWIQATNFIFWINLDVWEFFKVNSGTYKGIQHYDPPSGKMPLSYNFVLLAIGLLVFLLAVVILVIYVVLRLRRKPYLFVNVARIYRAVTIICQLLTIPVGVALFRLFHCNSSDQVDVMNEIQCFAGVHWAYIIPTVIVLFALFILFPAWMIHRIRREVLAATIDHHESYLQLKEMEYMSGLDVIWVVKGFHLFSSFNLRAVWYRPIMQVFKLLLLVIYAAGFSSIFSQALATAIMLSTFWFLILMLRPFRLTSFNVLLFFGYLCLTGDAIFGSCIAAYKPSLVVSPWLVEPYAVWVLVSINSILLISCIVFITHLVIYQFCCYQRLGQDPLWPSMASRNNRQVSKETKKYMYAVLKGRSILEKCRTMPALFAPVHELTQQIQIINAYLREAEKLEDGFHDTLWDLLDEMIDTHDQIESKSLFSESVKEPIRQNAEEFMKYMPTFSRRLAQRDYDFILVSPLKKRLLMKMSILGMFLHGKKDKKAKQHVTYPEIEKIWPKSLMRKIDDTDGEYCDDLYPEHLLGPDAEEMFESSTLQLPLELMELDEDDETDSCSTLLQPNSASDFKSQSGSVVSLQSGINNPMFENDEFPHSVNQESNKLTLTDFEVGESSDDIQQSTLNQQVGNLISLLNETGIHEETNSPSTLAVAGVEEGETNTDNLEAVNVNIEKGKKSKSKNGKDVKGKKIKK